MIQFRLALGLILLGLLFACAFSLPASLPVPGNSASEPVEGQPPEEEQPGLQPIPVPGHSASEPVEGMPSTPFPVPGHSASEPGLRQTQPPGERQPTIQVPGALVLRTLTEEQQRPNYFVFSNYPYLAGGSSAETIFAFNQAVEGQLLQQLALFKIDLASFRSETFSFSHPSTF